MIPREELTIAPRPSGLKQGLRSFAVAPWAPYPGTRKNASGRAAQVEGFPVDGEVLDLARLRVGGLDEDEEPPAVLLRGLDEWVHAVGPEERVDGDRVGGEGDEVGLRVRLGGLGDVAALDVAD